MVKREPQLSNLYNFLGVLCLVAFINIYSLSPNHEVFQPKVQQSSLNGFRQDSASASRLLDEKKNHRYASKSLSACLLIKDDNAVVNEWIAYHYHSISLRFLLVAVDPSSETSPSSIFRHWQKVTTEMGDPLIIKEWSDSDFMPKDFIEKGYHIPPRYIKGNANESKWHQGHEDEAQVIADKLRISNHRFRQVTFLSACLRHMQSQNKTWVAHIDTDEYVVVNPLLRAERDIANETIPNSPAEPAAVFDMLERIRKHKSLRKSSNYPCISLPRLLFGAVEKDNETVASTYASDMAFSLESLRWKYHTSLQDKERNAQPKVIVDVSKVSSKDEMFKPKPFSIHRPSKALCRRLDQIAFEETRKYPLSVNHYLGSWERYYSRNDTRRSRRAFDWKANVQDGRDDWISPWLDGFVDDVGLERARDLLEFQR